LAWSVAREHDGGVKLVSSRAGETIFCLTVARHMPESTMNANPPQSRVLTR